MRSPPHLSCSEESPAQAASNQRVCAYQSACSAQAVCSALQSQQLKLGAGELRRPRQASSQVRAATPSFVCAMLRHHRCMLLHRLSREGLLCPFYFDSPPPLPTFFFISVAHVAPVEAALSVNSAGGRICRSARLQMFALRPMRAAQPPRAGRSVLGEDLQDSNISTHSMVNLQQDFFPPPLLGADLRH